MYLRIRYVLDRLAALVALVVLSPVLLVTAVLIAVDGGPVLFRQERIGRHGRIFRVFKFRSMIVDADLYLDENGMPTRARTTRVGRIIRRTSIDELPQFLNILIGHMALIGPRPILPMFLPYMTAEEKRRLEVLPGISGWAQVNGRNSVKWSERFAMDVHYVENASPALDLKIVWMTLLAILSSRDIAQDRNATEVNDVTTRSLT